MTDDEKPWEPGDPLFKPVVWQEQPMIAIKEETDGSVTARWTPDKGWGDA